MTDIQIENRTITMGSRPFIVAEAGGNHNGNLEQMYRLIDIAADAGVDAVKIALSRAETQYPESAPGIDYFDTEETPYELIKRREVPYDWIPKLQSYCQENDLIFFSSCCDFETADVLDRHGVPVFKIPSYEATHIPLLKHVAQKDKPIILSRGITPYDEIERSIRTIREQGNDKIVLLHCTGSYPTPLDDINLRSIPDLHETFGVEVGISDHSRDPTAVPAGATAKEAAVIEKHYTLSNWLPGADHPFAVEPDELSGLVSTVDEVYESLGTPQTELSDAETEMNRLARRSVFTTERVEAGEKFTRSNTWVLRAGGLEPGLHPRHWNSVLGRTASRTISADTGLQATDVEGFELDSSS